MNMCQCSLCRRQTTACRKRPEYQSVVSKVKVLVAQSCPALCDSTDCSPPGSSVRGVPGKNTGVGSHSLIQGDLPNPGIGPGSPAPQVDSLPPEPPGKPHQSVSLGLHPSSALCVTSYVTLGKTSEKVQTTSPPNLVLLICEMSLITAARF